MTKAWVTPSRSSPKPGGNRACLCRDGRTYSRRCCDGSLQAQGIGNVTGNQSSTTTQWQQINTQWESINIIWNNL